MRTLQSKNFMQNYASNKRKGFESTFAPRPVQEPTAPRAVDPQTSMNSEYASKKSLTSIQEVPNSNMERSRGVPTTSAVARENSAESSALHPEDRNRNSHGDLAVGNTTSSFSYGQAAIIDVDLSLAQKPGRNVAIEGN